MPTAFAPPAELLSFTQKQERAAHARSHIGKKKKGDKTLANGQIKLRVSGRYADLLRGDLTIEDLDDEEIAMGKLKDKNGNFSGRPPIVLPREFHDAMQRELLKRGQREWHKQYLPAVRRIEEIGKYAESDSARLGATRYSVEQVQGKLPDTVNMNAVIKPYEEVMEEESGMDLGLSFEDGQPEIIDAEIVEET